MNCFHVFYCRCYQFLFNQIALPLVAFPEPELIEGKGSLLTLPSLLKKRGYIRPFLMISKTVKKSEYGQEFLAEFAKVGIQPILYDSIPSDPTFDSINNAHQIALKSNCDSLLALGGGSVIDAAKAVGALLANPGLSLPKMRGLLKIKKRYPMLIAIPTTAGTGSEVTIASVVSNPKAKEKFAISDPKLVPQIALLDANLLKTLPPSIIADTGMDALTHAVEAFIGNALTKKTKSAALKAVRLIKNNLLEFYRNPDHEEAASNMLKASYYAGQAFTRSYVGYVHAIAHSLGGEYHIPHGRANAIILPHMLRRYGKKADKKLSLLAEAIKLTKDGERKETKALAFISWIDTLKEKLGIPKYFSHLIRKEDIPSLALRAAKEGNPLYPVPKELSQKELMAFYEEIDPYED